MRSLMNLACVALFATASFQARRHLQPAPFSTIFRGLIAGFVLLTAGAAIAQNADQTAIAGLLHGMFDKPGSQFTVAPVVVSGTYAIAGWAQAEMGGRALLQKKEQDWALILCAGDGIKSRDALIKVGIPSQDAAVLEQELATAEGKLPAQQVAMFSRFEGIMMMDGSGDNHHAHHEHDH